MGFSDMLSSASSRLNSNSSKKPSHDEIFASAHVVMNAAKDKLLKADAEGVDYGKLAGAAGTLIGAASRHGKIKDTSCGKYARKAQKYLHSYEIKHAKPGMTVPPPEPSEPSGSPGHSQGRPPPPPPLSHTPSEVNLSQPSAPPLGYPNGYRAQGYPDVQQGYGHVPQGYTPSEVNLSQPCAPPSQVYPDVQQRYGHVPQGYAPSEVNQPSAPPQGYPQVYPDVQQRYGHAPQGYAPSEVNFSQPSPRPQGYPTGYSSQGYPEARQGYGHVPQGYSKPAELHANVYDYPPIVHPPAGYPTSGGNHNRPSKYS